MARKKKTTTTSKASTVQTLATTTKKKFIGLTALKKAIDIILGYISNQIELYNLRKQYPSDTLLEMKNLWFADESYSLSSAEIMDVAEIKTSASRIYTSARVRFFVEGSISQLGKPCLKIGGQDDKIPLWYTIGGGNHHLYFDLILPMINGEFVSLANYYIVQNNN